jgi:WD40-like Beta Propeller Repeat
MRRRRQERSGLAARRTAALLCTLAAAIIPAGVAHAEFGAATLLSNAPPLQFDEARNPAFSQNGEYVAFRGSLAGVSGVYRRDLRTGQIALVAGANSEAELNAPDAAAPSISADGRYVAFTSAHPLDVADDTGSGCPQVYVRDMDAPLVPDARVEEEARQAAAHGLPAPPEKPYTLASAVNGGEEGLTYEHPCLGRPANELALAGAQAAPGVALSADGREVAFTVLSASDLTAPCTTAPVKCPTEPSQVAVRDLETQTTTLVSATPEGGPTPGGGAFPANGVDGASSVSGGSASSAAISADGTTVAWQGTDVPAQVPSATDVTSQMAAYGGPTREVEPLWRRIADGPTAVTRRLLAGAGLNFYFPASHENSEVIEGGALAPVGQAFAPPALSADGRTAVTIANAPTAGNQASYEFLGYKAVPPADAYVSHVGEDEAAAVKVTPLTATPSFAATNAIIDGVSEVAISADGTRVAFDTRRVNFALAPPTLISPPAPEGAYSYTYEANLTLGTLQRVTSTWNGAPPSGDAGQVSFAGEGTSLAFASTAGNLFYGDATPGVSQVFLAEEQPAGELPPPQSLSAAPQPPAPAPEWMLSATAKAQRDGSVLVYAEVPGAGRLQARAAAQLPARSISDVPADKHQSRNAGRASSRGGAARANARIVTDTLARATASPTTASLVLLRLRVSRAYSALAAGRHGLYAIISVSFTAPGHGRLLRQIPVSFHRVAPRGRRLHASRRRGRFAARGLARSHESREGGR